MQAPNDLKHLWQPSAGERQTGPDLRETPWAEFSSTMDQQTADQRSLSMTRTVEKRRDAEAQG